MFKRREFGDAKNDTGTWHPWRPTGLPEGEPDVQLLVRGIPAQIENKITAAHKQDTVTVKFQRNSDMSETDINLERQRRIMRDRAAFALLDTKEYGREICDEEAAAIYAKLVGENVSKDQLVDMAGRWSNGQLKGHVLTEDAELTTRVCEIVDGISERREQAKEMLRGN